MPRVEALQIPIRAAYQLLHAHNRTHLWDPLCKALQVAPETVSQDVAVDTVIQIPALYESGIDRLHKTKKGITYTPPVIAQKITQSCSQKPDMKILDPACGAGIFLLTVFQEFSPRETSWEMRKQFLENVLYGIDIDAEAVLLTKLLLLVELALSDNVPDIAFSDLPNISVGDTLLEPPPVTSHKFDLIIGNPPYGISRDEKISQTDNKKLREKYYEAICGRVNKYLLFIWESLNLLSDDGTLAFLVPNAWLGIREATPVRKRLLMETQCSIEFLKDSVFQDRSVEPVILIAKKTSSPQFSETTLIRDSQRVSMPAWVTEQSPGLCIPTTWDARREHFCKKLLAHTHRIGDDSSQFNPRIALQAYSVGKGSPPQSPSTQAERAFHSKTKKSDEWIPYLEGKDIGRYRRSWSGEYLQYGPWLAEMQSLDRFCGPRIVLREITGSLPYLIQATLVEEPYLYNKSILHILPKNGATKSTMLALLALLNSKLISTWLSTFGRKCQRTLFPKIVLDDLKDIPLPDLFFRYEKVLAELALRQLTRYTEDIDIQIEEICNELFDISRKPIQSELHW